MLETSDTSLASGSASTNHIRISRYSIKNRGLISAGANIPSSLRKVFPFSGDYHIGDGPIYIAHHHEGHTGAWQTCTTCRESVDTEDSVVMVTNEDNFEKLQNPPDYEPTTCAVCGPVIIRAQGGSSKVPNKGCVCGACSFKDLKGGLSPIGANLSR